MVSINDDGSNSHLCNGLRHTLFDLQLDVMPVIVYPSAVYPPCCCSAEGKNNIKWLNVPLLKGHIAF